MVETIESFVAKLQADGVDAGRQEAEKLRADARAEADKIIAAAKADADKILADAKTQAADLLARGKTELSLAARAAVLKLQVALALGPQAIVAQAVRILQTEHPVLARCAEIGVDQEDALTRQRKPVPQGNRGGGFPHTPFLIDD